ncbi:site-specific DNA-methyltransferase [Limnoglobus roseus]|uniref:site-specific DNA-methyltransferase (adenine-specific) n=1 Tax=Limnoglobus roseus TaxID=2598579 RepID=A0A5C1AJQ9_9BACT|nr:site-specific DNA-methyltransferase [Limnoglobus roseus]QEL17384.1 site-specific DNA-methyltransferase [Limnoglobus roseus]
MAKRKTAAPAADDAVTDYRHADKKRKNIPPAKMAAEGTVPVMPKIGYSYSPRRPPVLRFDSHGGADKLPELLEKAKKSKLTEDEVRVLAEALRTHEPWLEWAGKCELPGFAVDPVALHIHERVSAQAILKVAARHDVERNLFGDPEQAYHEAVQFYRHDVDWTNRLILGDSLQVMASLAKREELAGKVQMIYLDPPYGIKFASNFQPEVGKRDVKDKEQDLTREAEMVKAYRDTWHLGIHSYLTYLRDRLIAAKELLADTGSIFVQISDENLHRVSALLDEVFGSDNFCSLITFQKTAAVSSPEARTKVIGTLGDYLLWFAKNKDLTKYNQLYLPKGVGTGAGEDYRQLLLADGSRRPISQEELDNPSKLPANTRVFQATALQSSGHSISLTVPFTFNNKSYSPNPNSHWKTTVKGLSRLVEAGRVTESGKNIRYVRCVDDFSVSSLGNIWGDTMGSPNVIYVVQTNARIVERCMLMTTDPGDLVLDPTCGSGTTAFVAEQWGRRWITTDTSRVAVAIARQRLLTSKFDYYELRDEKKGLSGNLVYKTVPHVTLKSIAQNQNLDPIFAKYGAALDAKLSACNAALVNLTKDVRFALEAKLLEKERAEGKRAVMDADRRRWVLPDKGNVWQHWTVPFDTDTDYSAELMKAVTDYRKTWRAKMDEVNDCIARNAEQEELVDQPRVVKNRTRVSGPFTVEAVQPPEISLGDVSQELPPIGGAPEELEGSFAPARQLRLVETRNAFEVQNIDAYLTEMTRLLRGDGVRFPNNKEMTFSRLDRVSDGHGIHAEGRWVPPGEQDADPAGDATVGVIFGPQYGPFTSAMLELVIKPAQRKYDDLVVAGFSFSPEVYDLAANPQVKNFKVHVAHIRPDVNPGMNGLLKETPRSQLFTVFGLPRTRVDRVKGKAEYVVTMEGVDIYDPVRNVVHPTEDSKVAAWFLDGDYDGRTFCVTQAFFPDKSAWEKLSKALGGVVDPERFEALSGTKSLPFPAGGHRCVAVKVIDPRGNEVMQVHKLEDVA